MPEDPNKDILVRLEALLAENCYPHGRPSRITR